MDWITGIQRAIDYIEEHLNEDIDFESVASQSFSSSYHFQRVFSILCGYTLGEYIRNRRLSLAGNEISSTKAKIIDVALKYGYDSPDSFTKAFRKFHGITPSEARKKSKNLKSFSRLVINISLEGGNIMNYRIEEKSAITLVGHKLICSGSPTNPDNAFNATKRHWLSSRNIQKILKEKRNGQPIWYDVYSDFDHDLFTHTIASEIDGEIKHEDLSTIRIQPHVYAVFETERCESPDEKWLELFKRIVSEWLPTTNYLIDEHPFINKIYYDRDFSKRYIEVWIPIK